MHGRKRKLDSENHLMISGVRSLLLRVLEDMCAAESSRIFGAGTIKKGSYEWPIELGM